MGRTGAHNAGKKLLLVLLVLTAFAASRLLVTGLVYGGVFSRYDGESRESSAHRIPCRFASGGELLRGYLYPAGENTDLIVIAPGFRAVQDDYLPVTEALLDAGYSVFTFDPTGVGESGGSDQRGFPQIAADVSACLDMIETSGRFGCRRLFLIGHSRGGYGVCCVLDEHPEVDGAAAVGAVSSAIDGVMSGSAGMIGGAAYLNYPFLLLWQDCVFGSAANEDAVTSVNASSVPVLILHGESDSKVSGRLSLFSRADELKEGAKSLMLDGGHVDSVYSDGAADADFIAAVTEFFASVPSN